MFLRLLIVLALSLAFIAADTARWAPLQVVRQIGYSVLEPVFVALAWPGRVINEVSERLTTGEALREENIRLRQQNLNLSVQNQRFAFLVMDNAHLRGMQNRANGLDDTIKLAEVIGVDPSPSRHVVIINRGIGDGFRVGMPVLDASGILGRIVQVGQTTSRVMLITDRQHSVPVRINRNGIRAILSGTGSATDLQLQFVSETSDVKVGDLLVTSGLGNDFPAGYPVARVSKMRNLTNGEFVEITAVPLSALDRSRYVMTLIAPSSAPAPKRLSEVPPPLVFNIPPMPAVMPTLVLPPPLVKPVSDAPQVAAVEPAVTTPAPSPVAPVPPPLVSEPPAVVTEDATQGMEALASATPVPVTAPPTLSPEPAATPPLATSTAAAPVAVPTPASAPVPVPAVQSPVVKPAIAALATSASPTPSAGAPSVAPARGAPDETSVPPQLLLSKPPAVASRPLPAPPKSPAVPSLLKRPTGSPAPLTSQERSTPQPVEKPGFFSFLTDWSASAPADTKPTPEEKPPRVTQPARPIASTAASPPPVPRPPVALIVRAEPTPPPVRRSAPSPLPTAAPVPAPPVRAPSPAVAVAPQTQHRVQQAVSQPPRARETVRPATGLARQDKPPRPQDTSSLAPVVATVAAPSERVKPVFKPVVKPVTRESLNLPAKPAKAVANSPAPTPTPTPATRPAPERVAADPKPPRPIDQRVVAERKPLPAVEAKPEVARPRPQPKPARVVETGSDPVSASISVSSVSSDGVTTVVGTASADAVSLVRSHRTKSAPPPPAPAPESTDAPAQ